MSHYLVRAEPRDTGLEQLRTRLSSGEIKEMRPFGTALQKALENARIDKQQGEILWEEEDYCTPPLKQEREAVLDHYFDLLEIEEVEQGEGWRRLEGLPGLWSQQERQKFGDEN